MMNKDQIKQLIIEIVNDSTGIKATELTVKLLEKILPFEVDNDIISECIEECIRDGRILEFEYTLPRMNYRVKSMYFPRGTSITGRDR